MHNYYIIYFTIVFFIIIACLFAYLYVNKIKKEKFYIGNYGCKLISKKQDGNDYIFCYSCPIMAQPNILLTTPSTVSKPVSSIAPTITQSTTSNPIYTLPTQIPMSATTSSTTTLKSTIPQSSNFNKPRYDSSTFKAAFDSGNPSAYLKEYDASHQIVTK